MGIKGLSKLLGDQAPGCMTEHELKTFFGRKIAIDASMSIYQFLVTVRSAGDSMTNKDGEVTSHLIGLFYRTIRLIEMGIKPVYVFDGKPPAMKSGELQKRTQAKQAAADLAKKAEEEGDQDNYEKYNRRVNTVSKSMLEQCKTLLRLMGVPVVEAPCEAEAQCVELTKSGKVYATASEDMDALTFGTPRLIRQLWAGASTTAEKNKIRPVEISLDAALDELHLTMDQFRDLCILCGCDYVNSIKGIGPNKALKLVQEHKTLESIVALLEKDKKYQIPEEFPIDAVRGLFISPEVTPSDEIDLEWKPPQEDELVQFMCVENQFSEKNVRNGVEKIRASKGKAGQMRLDSFFKPQPSKTIKKAAPKKVNFSARGGKGKAKK
ncbi:Flap endonuclease 1 [Porphyridium purpureum]|uniref:Flap endonuclease 1 n=1 Tax=Porphyridium purpureum TaxID=35688 RepID=A0A5J4YMH8_PORPP|nr:Flap endonuclease 1 [Porphyridium purpureum]|eukprot:POR9875..scf244_11